MAIVPNFNIFTVCHYVNVPFTLKQVHIHFQISRSCVLFLVAGLKFCVSVVHVLLLHTGWHSFMCLESIFPSSYLEHVSPCLYLEHIG